MNLLIPYVHLYGHNDPLFEEFTYGDGGARARKLKNDLRKGDFVFFHTSTRGRKFITAYYIVEKVLDTAEAIKDRNIIAKYKNPHIMEFLKGERTDEDDDVLIFGNPITSRVLARPLLFDKVLAKKLSLDIKFKKGKTDTQVIGSATRAWRRLTDNDVKILLKEIKSFEEKGLDSETRLSTEEVTEVIEKDIENFIEKNTSLIGKSFKLVGRQLGDIPGSRIDLLFEDKEGNKIIVELKLHKIGRSAINQLRRYISWLKKKAKKEVKGIIVCSGVMPAFEDEFKKLKDIRIFCYGWQLKVYPWRKT